MGRCRRAFWGYCFLCGPRKAIRGFNGRWRGWPRGWNPGSGWNGWDRCSRPIRRGSCPRRSTRPAGPRRSCWRNGMGNRSPYAGFPRCSNWRRWPDAQVMPRWPMVCFGCFGSCLATPSASARPPHFPPRPGRALASVGKRPGRSGSTWPSARARIRCWFQWRPSGCFPKRVRSRFSRCWHWLDLLSRRNVDRPRCARWGAWIPPCGPSPPPRRGGGWLRRSARNWWA